MQRNYFGAVETVVLEDGLILIRPWFIEKTFNPLGL